MVILVALASLMVTPCVFAAAACIAIATKNSAAAIMAAIRLSRPTRSLMPLRPTRLTRLTRPRPMMPSRQLWPMMWPISLTRLIWPTRLIRLMRLTWRRPIKPTRLRPMKPTRLLWPLGPMWLMSMICGNVWLLVARHSALQMEREREMIRIDKRVRSLEEISKNLLGNWKLYIPFKMTNNKSPP